MSNMDVLRERVRDFRESVPVIDINADQPATLVRTPVEVGMDRFIDLSKMPDLDDLPFVTEQKKDFAFRYATESKPQSAWAKVFNVHPGTIRRWLQDEGVQILIAMTKVEARIYALAETTVLQKKFYTVLNALLDKRITTDGMPTTLLTLKFVHRILNEDAGGASNSKRIIHKQIGFPSSGPAPMKTVGGMEVDIPVKRTITDEELESKRKEVLDQIYRIQEVNTERHDGNGNGTGS